MTSSPQTSPHHHPPTLSPAAAIALLVLASTFWGGNIFVGRAVHEAVPPVALSFWRWVIAFFILLPFAWPKLRRDWSAILRHWRMLTLLAFFGMAAFNTSVYLAVNYTTATNAALLFATCPVMVPVLSWAIDREAITGRIVLAILVSLLGAAVVVTRGELAQILQLRFNRGDLIMLGAVFSWAVYTALLKRRPSELHPQSQFAAIMVIATVLLFPIYLWEALAVRSMPLTGDALMALAYVVVFASLLAFYSFGRGIEVLGPNRGGLFLHLIPVSAALLAVVFLGERLQPYHGLGTAAIVAGIALASLESGFRR
jgi:drug/metabolite transporter (DMT)-like permease